MSYPVMPLGFLGSQGDNDTYRIERSLRFNSDDVANLTRTMGTPTSQTTATLSLWVKRGKISISSFGSSFWNPEASNYNIFCFSGSSTGNTDTLAFHFRSGGSYYSNAVYRDPSAWYHIVCVYDSTNATQADRFRFFVNGVRGTFITAPTFAQNYTFDGAIGAGSYLIGKYNFGGNNWNGDMTLAEYYWIDGQALTPSSFGETDAITGRWKAKAYSGTYGTNGFYLKFADNSGTTATTLGKDSSGNGNNWTPNNFSVTAGAGNDSLVDSPTNYGTDTGVGGEVRGNYPVFNSASKNSSVTISDGGLRAAFTNNRFQSVTIPIPTTGKWYAEFTVLNGSSSYSIGLGDITQNADSSYSLLSSSPAISYINNGNKNVNGTVNAGGATYTTNDVIGVAVDSGSSSVSFYKNNSLQFTVSGSSFSTHAGKWVFGGDASAFSEVLVFNGGQRPFAYAAPSGFKALCTTNLPTPTIKKPSSYMDVVTYTGNGSARSITGLGFSPDLVWIKGRSGATDHAIYDSVRGAQLDMASNLSSAETTQSQGLTAFNSDGFSIGTLAKINTNTSTYVGWAWDAGETSSTNTDGSITSTVRVNAQAGVSIVRWTDDTSTNNRVGHGLGVTPAVVLYKRRNSTGSDWYWTTTKIDGSFDSLVLNSTAAKTDIVSPYTAPTSTTFSNYGTWSGGNLIAYCFAEVQGFSKFGSYTGNGSSDGPFVWCGFRPRYVLFKNASAAYHWFIYDTARNTVNAVTSNLYASSSAAEQADASLDILSNGFKLRSATYINDSTNTITFAAFAESPFKYARAR